MRRFTFVLIVLVLNMTIVELATMVPTVPAEPGLPLESMATYHLSYKGRYEHQPKGPDHLLGLEMVNGELLVTGYLGAYFVDWSLANSSYLTTYISHFKPKFNITTNRDDAPVPPESENYSPSFYGSVTYDAGGGTKYIYINARYVGIYILSTRGTNLKYQGRIIQNRRFSEGLAIDGDYLYAAHHADGIEIYDLSANPASPTVVGNITTGFTDAWAVFPAGNTLYVADGRGGLKVVDISNKANPSITWSEDPTTSPGNMMDVVAVGDYVYGACGGQGIAVYKRDAFDQRTVTMINGSSQALARMAQEDIAVAARSWIHVIRPDGAGGFDILASERMIRRAGDKALMGRIAQDILVVGKQVVSASWDQVDVYELMDNPSDNQPDVLFGKQMVNFGVDGRSESIKIENQGTANLKLHQPQIESKGKFQATLSKGWVPPGDFAWLTITHDGRGNDTRANITIQTNDPDENPIRFMAYGRTRYVDIGEPMYNFTLDSGQGDFSGPTPEWTFTNINVSDRVGERVPVLETPLPDLTMEEDNVTSGIDLLNVSGHFTSGTTGKVTLYVIVGSWCPACPPAFTSIGYDFYQRYQHRDDFDVYLMSKMENNGTMMHLMEKTRIPGGMIFDEVGNITNRTLKQYDVGLPFGRSYIVDHKGIIRSVGRGYNPHGAWKVLDGIFAEIDNATDLRYEVSYEENPLILEASGGNGPLFSFIQNQPNWIGSLSFKVRALNSGEDWIPNNSDDMSLESNLFNVTVLPKVLSSMINIDPNTLNLKSKGRWITCYINLNDPYDVNNIDISTILLEDTIPAEWGDIQSDTLMVKFDRSDVEDMLSIGTYNLKVTGELTDGTSFGGYSDEIRVIDPGK
ncbi:MAG: hypothetical protein JSW00_04395 [Thermoplasmata archaeon]|nr:MAG: hypothetical protein JSW00_04395 [Thermoplasmata archaeon]